MTALLLDVGNTRLKWGVLEGGAIRRTGHITQANIREAGLAALTSKLPRDVDAVMALIGQHEAHVPQDVVGKSVRWEWEDQATGACRSQ